MTAKSIIFNQYALPQPNEQAVFVFADEPVIQLDQLDADQGKQFPRHAAQNDVLQSKNLRLDDESIFGPDLAWACRGYIVQRLSQPKGRGLRATKLGLAPIQPVDQQRRTRQLEKAALQPKAARWIDEETGQAAVDLYLFNVLVALEWQPDARYMEQLQWAFRRASDFLYDVTDGSMALGQVVFGGSELMGCADVQIMASNRLHPRAWVSGLHDPQKYTPVRMGRGMWSRRNCVSIPWDEPEGYRTFVHEWAHYALNLRDQYLIKVERDGQQSLIVPECTVASSSIMATLEGTSELVPHRRGSKERKREEWKRIHQHFPGLSPNAQPLSGPGRLTLPLPLFQRVGSLQAAPRTSTHRTVTFDTAPLAALAANEPDRCWVWALHENNGTPQRLIAQGSLDANTASDGFELLGAADGDTIIFVQHPTQAAPTIMQATLNGATLDAIQPLTMPAPPLIDVLPQVRTDAPDKPDTAFVRVRVQSRSDELPQAVWLFPFGQDHAPLLMGRPDTADWYSAPQHVPTLDGHVLAQWANGQRLLTTFSQGGGPPTHGPVTGAPVTAGSSDGNIMIFFRDEDWSDPADAPDGQNHNNDYSHIKVVTTIMQGVEPDTNPATRSYVYSLASTHALPTTLSPTLVMYYEAASLDYGTPQIARLTADGAGVTVLNNGHVKPGCGYIAVALDATTAPSLINDPVAGPRVERYRIIWR